MKFKYTGDMFNWNKNRMLIPDIITSIFDNE